MDEVQSGAESEPQLYKPTTASNGFVAGSTNQVVSPTDNDISTVEWSASEYVAHEKSSSWYLGTVFFGAILTALIYFITTDIFVTAVVFIAGASMAIYAGRKPDTKQYQLDDKGIKVADKIYPYSNFKSFSIVEEGAIDSIWLKPMKRFSPLVVVYFSPEDEAKIIDVLANFLPHEQRELDFIDQISKKMRF